MKVINLKDEGNGDIGTGLDKKARKEVAAILSRTLADSYTLALKTLNYHWNVTGPHFQALHAMFEEQYKTMLPAVDELAERIRALGYVAPGSYREFSSLARLGEDKQTPSGWQTMIKNLLSDHEAVASHIRDDLSKVQRAGDEATADMFIGRLEYHEKTAWMLRSLLAK